MIWKTLKWFVIGLVVIVGGFLIAGALQPKDYRVERSHTYHRPVGELFSWFDNHRKFNEFNPWVKMDPDATLSYDGPESGVGAISGWDGKLVGQGTATITEVKPNELVRLRMDWKKPMAGVSWVDYIFREADGKATVTWAMYGENNYVGKLMSLIMDCESICGPEFEKGLASLDQLLASSSAENAK
jgi:hypothetical protein